MSADESVATGVANDDVDDRISGRGIWSATARRTSSAESDSHADGPLVVVVHGSMDRSTGMLKLSRQIDDRWDVLRYDRRGYGRSGPHPGPFGMIEQIDDLLDLVGRDQTRPLCLVGHSYGGNVVLGFAARHPERVMGVAIYETPLSWEPWWPGSTAGAQAVATQGSPDEAAERFMRRLIGDERWEGLPERTRVTRRMEGAAMVGELTDLRLHEPWSADQISVPVLAGYGTNGAPHHRRGMEYVAETVADCRLVELPSCRHDAPLSHPVLFASLLVEPLLA